MSVGNECKTFSDSIDGFPSYEEPVAKRTRASLNNSIGVIEVEDVDYEPTILDMLNEYCWQVVLDYVSVRRLVRSECVSKRWRGVVQQYLRNIRICMRCNHYLKHVPEPRVKCRTVIINPQFYINVVLKFKQSIIAADCVSEIGLRCLRKFSPDLEDLRVYGKQNHKLKNRPIRFNKLKRLLFQEVRRFDDKRTAKFLDTTTLEELYIHSNESIGGCCFRSLKSKLKTLRIYSCNFFGIEHMLPARKYLSDLTRLEMNYNRSDVIEDLHKLLKFTPELEYLSLEWYLISQARVEKLVEAICGLTKLRYLNLCSNQKTNDYWLEEVGRCCELRSVNLENCGNVTPDGVRALCDGVANSLVALDVSNSYRLTDDDVVHFIITCPKLEVLNLKTCHRLSVKLRRVRAAAAGRSPPLRLHLSKRFHYEKWHPWPDVLYRDGLIMDYRQVNFNCLDYII